jgi:ketopantoate reductase
MKNANGIRLEKGMQSRNPVKFDEQSYRYRWRYSRSVTHSFVSMVVDIKKGGCTEYDLFGS